MILLNRLDKRIKIYKNSDQRNKLNEVTGEPILVAEVWAAVEPLRGKEYFSASAEQVEVTTRIRIRYKTGINRTMWVEYNGITFEIESVIHSNYGKVELHLMCKERQ